MMQRIVFWITLLIGGFVGSLLFDVRFFPTLLRSPLFHLFTFLPGALLFFAVMRVSRNTGRWLAREGRIGDVPQLETNRLVTTGPYACMRHPMHFGLLFFPMSIALLVGSPTFMGFIAPLEAVIILLLIKVYEEPEVREKFGEAYRKYMERVPMFALSPSCLRQLFRSRID